LDVEAIQRKEEAQLKELKEQIDEYCNSK